MKTKYNSKEDKLFFTSDTHFGHQNIIRFCNRPYESAEEMNEKLIENWNRVVPEDGIVFHLGDFAFGGTPLWKSVCERLNGKIHLVVGNHDMKNLRAGAESLFESVNTQLQLNIDGRAVYLNHYPFLCYGGAWRNPDNAVWQLFGHVHSGPDSAGKDSDRLNHMFPYQYDVGVDNNNYAPISWATVQEKIAYQVEHGISAHPIYDSKHTIPDELYKE